MKALTLWQPWASLVALGVKTIETRSWSTKYRGPLAIHAAARRPPVLTSVGGWTVFSRSRVLDPYDTRMVCVETNRSVPLPLGAVVATADLVDVVPIVECPEYRRDARRNWSGTIVCQGAPGTLWLAEPGPVHPIHDQLPYGDFTPGRYAWILDNIEALDKPVPAKGRQGLWEWTS